MKTPILIVLSIVMLMTTGCQAIKEIDDAAGKWAREMKADRAAREKARHDSRVLTATTRSGCQKVLQTVTLSHIDPDTVYVRIKRYFGFNTQREAEKSYPYPEWLAATNYSHVALPGVRYSLSEGVTWPSTAYGRRDIWLNIDIERENRNTVVTWDYCINADGYEKLGDRKAIKRNLATDIKRVALGK